MSKYLKSKYQIFICIPLVIYLLMNTGLFSDEFTLLLQMQNKSLLEALRPDAIFINCPLSQYLFKFFLFFSRNGQTIIIQSLKVLYAVILIYLVSKFFSIFLTENKALVASFLFIFYPIHDSVTYFFLAQQFLFNFAFYCYAYYLAYNNRLVLACIFSFLGAFVYYGSPPVALGLFILFLLQKQIKKGLIIYLPNLVYIIYYLLMVKLFAIGDSSKLPKVFSIIAFIKYFTLQILTFIDAMIGPSMWMKVYYSFYQLSLMSWIIGGLIITVLLYLSIGKMPYLNKRLPRQIIANNNNIKLMISFAVMLFASFAMFAITGKYPQMAFNFGNRTTIYGAFILAYLIVAVPLLKRNKAIIYSLLILIILGVSDHWKRWTVHQQKVIEQIKNNEILKAYHDEGIIYVSGNQYSKYGPISHIEFLSEDWVTASVFSSALNKDILTRSLNKRLKYINGYLIDTKYNFKTKIDDNIYVYDSEKNILFRLETGKINSYVESLPADNRHWIQLVDNKFIKEVIKKLMPRLEYAL